jgi:hypothetical protein
MAIQQLLREYIKLILFEAPVPLRRPKTHDQQLAFVRLLQWVAPKMGAPPEMVQDAVDKAIEHDDWSDAIDLLRDYYVMKGIKFQQAA